jgi:hypothetical protein
MRPIALTVPKGPDNPTQQKVVPDVYRTVIHDRPTVVSSLTNINIMEDELLFHKSLGVDPTRDIGNRIDVLDPLTKFGIVRREDLAGKGISKPRSSNQKVRRNIVSLSSRAATAGPLESKDGPPYLIRKLQRARFPYEDMATSTTITTSSSSQSREFDSMTCSKQSKPSYEEINIMCFEILPLANVMWNKGDRTPFRHPVDELDWALRLENHPPSLLNSSENIIPSLENSALPSIFNNNVDKPASGPPAARTERRRSEETIHGSVEDFPMDDNDSALTLVSSTSEMDSYEEDPK